MLSPSKTLILLLLLSLTLDNTCHAFGPLSTSCSRTSTSITSSIISKHRHHGASQSPVASASSRRIPRSPRTRILLKATSKEDEIAALEEQLRLLKQNDATTEPTSASSSSQEPESKSVEEKEETDERSWKVPERNPDDTIAVRKVPIASMSNPMDEMLSEQWKVSNFKSSGGNVGVGGGVMKNVIGAVVLLVGVVAFSQIPVGQENLDKYSTAKPSTTIDLGDLNPVKVNSIGMD